MANQDDDNSTNDLHPLEHLWCFYHMNGNDKDDWLKRFTLLNNLDSVESFWSTYNFIRHASNLSPNNAYVVFRDGIQPMWEDPQNKNGGRWLIQMDRSYDSDMKDTLWLSVLLLTIGNDWEIHDNEWRTVMTKFGIYYDDIVEKANKAVRGVFYDQRSKGDRISLWTADGLDNYVNFLIGMRIFEVTQGCVKLMYQTYDDINRRTSSIPYFSIEISAEIKPDVRYLSNKYGSLFPNGAGNLAR